MAFKKSKSFMEDLTSEKVKENLELIKQDKPLNFPLSLLKKSQEFNDAWKEIMKVAYQENHKEYSKQYQREYNQRPEIKQKKKEYYQNNKQYFQQKAKEYMKEYRLKIKLQNAKTKHLKIISIKREEHEE